MLLTLSIAVYNKPEILRLILLSCTRQTFTNFEVIVADDGSGPAVAEVIEEVRQQHRLTIRHLWHEDRGWRKNVMLNNVVSEAATDYIVFIDGDCLLHHRFLEDHWKSRAPGVALCGRRVEMGQRWASVLNDEMILSGRFEKIGLREIGEGLRGEGLRVEDGVRLPNRIASRLHGSSARLLGSNFSLHRQDIEAINGFDERYRGPGYGEDSDIQYRLELAGIRCVALRHRAIQFHVHHARTMPAESSGVLFEETQKRGEAWCSAGLRNTITPSESQFNRPSQS
jgi:glycosyltransferase involved in cell wall biosynthesis